LIKANALPLRQTANQMSSCDIIVVMTTMTLTVTVTNVVVFSQTGEERRLTHLADLRSHNSLIKHANRLLLCTTVTLVTSLT